MKCVTYLSQVQNSQLCFVLSNKFWLVVCMSHNTMRKKGTFLSSAMSLFLFKGHNYVKEIGFLDKVASSHT